MHRYYVAVYQVYRETMEISEDVKLDAAAETKNTSQDTSATDDITDTNDVDVKTEEG